MLVARSSSAMLHLHVQVMATLRATNQSIRKTIDFDIMSEGDLHLVNQ